MLLLAQTLNEFLQETRGKRGHLTIEILEFNQRIGKEMMEASEKHQLLEYLGMKILKEKEANHDTVTKTRL